MEAWLGAGLSVIIASGLITIAAVALANIVGLRIHDRRKGNGLYLYLSDDAQNLRERFRKLPWIFRTVYLVFTFFVFISIVYGIFYLEENSSSSSSIFQAQDIVLFVLTMAVTYKIHIVILTANISSHLYRVLRDA